MGAGAHAKSFAALFFPYRGGDTSVMYVSTPPPPWLCEGDLSKIVIEEMGIYCLFFLVPSPRGAAELAVNGVPIKGSRTEASEGALCGSAVCSIHDRALPCCLEVRTEGASCGGVFVVVRVDV